MVAGGIRMCILSIMTSSTDFGEYFELGEHVTSGLTRETDMCLKTLRSGGPKKDFFWIFSPQDDS